MRKVVSTLKSFAQNQDGLETVEYAIVAALITGAAVTAITSLGGAVAARFNILLGRLGG